MSRSFCLPATAMGLVLSMTLLSGCSSSDTSPGDDSANTSPTPTSTHMALPEGWSWVEGTDIPSVTADPQLPTTVTDGTGTSVTVTDVSKVIVGGEDIADIMAAMGLADNVYAAPTNSVAEAATSAPVQYEYSQKTGTEGLLSVDGSLFIGNQLQRHSGVAGQFRDAGVPAVVVDNKLSVPDKIRAVGSYIGDAEAGEQLADAVQTQLDEANASAADSSAQSLRVLVVTATGAGGQNSVVGSGTAAADIVSAVGAIDVGVEMGLTGYSVEYSDEGLLQAAPDVIVMGDGDLEAWGGLEGFEAAFPTLATTPAGQSNRYIVMPSEQIKVSGAGTGAGAQALAEALAAIEK